MQAVAAFRKIWAILYINMAQHKDKNLY